MRGNLDALRFNVTQLKVDCEQYVQYASDGDEREAIISAKNGLESLAKTSSSAQIDGIG